MQNPMKHRVIYTQCVKPIVQQSIIEPLKQSFGFLITGEFFERVFGKGQKITKHFEYSDTDYNLTIVYENGIQSDM